MQAEGITPTSVFAGQQYTWGSVQALVLNPQTTFDSDPNENSVVLLVSYENTKWMFTGDIGADTEQIIINSGTNLQADVLKVAHHGSAYATSAGFLNAVLPDYAVISVGDNSYGHPTQAVLDRLEAIGSEVMRTDELGTIVLQSDELGPPIDLSYMAFLPAVVHWGVPEPTPTAGEVHIISIFSDGLQPRVEGDEYAVIRNIGDAPVSLDGGRLNAGAPGQDFHFPIFTMQPNQECRVYTNEYHLEYCGFNFGSSSALWNNAGDCGYLYNSSGALVSTLCY